MAAPGLLREAIHEMVSRVPSWRLHELAVWRRGVRFVPAAMEWSAAATRAVTNGKGATYPEWSLGSAERISWSSFAGGS
ncbi:MAG: hypothetical protein Kow0069_04000 [Promethearchaeota archaeon]